MGRARGGRQPAGKFHCSISRPRSTARTRSGRPDRRDVPHLRLARRGPAHGPALPVRPQPREAARALWTSGIVVLRQSLLPADRRRALRFYSAFPPAVPFDRPDASSSGSSSSSSPRVIGLVAGAVFRRPCPPCRARSTRRHRPGDRLLPALVRPDASPCTCCGSPAPSPSSSGSCRSSWPSRADPQPDGGRVVLTMPLHHGIILGVFFLGSSPAASGSVRRSPASSSGSRHHAVAFGRGSPGRGTRWWLAQHLAFGLLRAWRAGSGRPALRAGRDSVEERRGPLRRQLSIAGASRRGSRRHRRALQGRPHRFVPESVSSQAPSRTQANSGCRRRATSSAGRGSRPRCARSVTRTRRPRQGSPRSFGSGAADAAGRERGRLQREAGSPLRARPLRLHPRRPDEQEGRLGPPPLGRVRRLEEARPGRRSPPRRS